MGIEADDIARVRSATDIVAVISEHTEIKRVGKQWMARCPLHGERTPSLSVSQDKGVYYCFGCQRSGDVITFVREIEGVDFVGAVEMLAARAGISLNYTSRSEGAARKRRRRLLDAVGRARAFYHDRLLGGPDAGPARAYLRRRGYSGETVRRYRIGWAPDAWDELARHVGLSDADLRESGLGFANRSGSQQDFFRARLMFPICDERGDPVGFGGRRLPGSDGGGKYINTSAAASVYDKSRVLYGLHEHRAAIVKAREAVVCEGYTDVIGCAAADIDRAVATCGTALTAEHVGLLKRFSASRLVLAFDADAAGGAAAERVYEWERQHELEVLVADMPPGADPGDLARSDPDGLRRAVDEAAPLLQFRVERVFGRHHMSTLENRARAAAAAASAVGEHPDAMVRDRYLMEIADRCRVEVRLLRQAADRAPDPATGARPPRGPAFGAETPEAWADDRLTAEDEAIRLAIHQPRRVDGLLHGSLFGDPMRREAFEALQSSPPETAAASGASERAARLLHRLAVDPGRADAEDVLAGVARLAVPRAMRELRRAAGSTGEAALRQQCSAALAWLKSRSELLSDRRTRAGALEELLPWLIEHGRRSEDAAAPEAAHPAYAPAAEQVVKE